MDKKLELLFEDLEANGMDNYAYKYNVKEANQIIRKHFEALILPVVVRQSEQLPEDKSHRPCDGCTDACKNWEIFFCKIK